MPIYEFKCLQCGKHFEVMQRFNEQNPKSCPDCEGEVRKLISNTSFILKGTGWYATDYASPERKKALEAEKGSDSKQDSTSTTSKDINNKKNLEVSSQNISKTAQSTK
ncbi:MAG: zinc ribbon domain-containing protein [Thermodesulfovibrionales bacterium]|nr:zinc ribbon domain-containing protein [Thermodesulfovibrionales bacterium]